MRPLTLSLFLFLAMVAKAQQTAPDWLEATLYGNGKLNTVLIVVGIIVIGIGWWMFRMDVRLRKLEREQDR
ncbi:MAG: hypothetical protein KDB84_06740 [Flavobacteriales bacterium]|nr:hypothetical protein [Flavobacteriales bacterium]